MPEQRRFSVGAVSLVVKTWSAAHDAHAPVVLLPATAETADDWDEVAAVLSSSRTVHAVNLRGHGSSDWPGTYSVQLLVEDVAALLPQLSDHPVDLVAHSLGGLVACRVASTHPEIVARLVLEDVGLLRPRRPSPPARPTGVLDFDWRLVEQVRPEIDDPDPRWAQTASTITAPTLVIAGGPSSTTPQEDVADLARTIPDAQLVTMDTGHLVHAAQPAAFCDAVLAFLDGGHRRSGAQLHALDPDHVDAPGAVAELGGGARADAAFGVSGSAGGLASAVSVLAAGGGCARWVSTPPSARSTSTTCTSASSP